MKAVLFDVYGTLLAGTRRPDRDPPLSGIVRSFGLEWPAGSSLAAALDREIAAAHRLSPEPFPEIDIREIWTHLLPGLRDADAFALAAENAIHPVALMPGALDAISRAHRSGLTLGILSNAQAYTPVLLRQHLGPVWEFFDPALHIFSHTHLIAKPDPRLLQFALKVLAGRGIAPADTLMIGDSIQNDILPARALGLQTHHFRGPESITTQKSPGAGFPLSYSSPR